MDPRIPWICPVVWFLTALRIGLHCRLGYRGANARHAPTVVCYGLGGEASGCLVVPAVFNTDVVEQLDQAGSIPVRLRRPQGT